MKFNLKLIFQAQKLDHFLNLHSIPNMKHRWEKMAINPLITSWMRVGGVSKHLLKLCGKSTDAAPEKSTYMVYFWDMCGNGINLIGGRRRKDGPKGVTCVGNLKAL